MGYWLASVWWGFEGWLEDTWYALREELCRRHGHRWEPTGEIQVLTRDGCPWMIRRGWGCTRCVAFRWLDCSVKLSGWDREPPKGDRDA